MSWTRFLFSIVTIFLTIFFDLFLAVHLLNTTSGIYEGRTVYFNKIIIQQYLGIEYGRIRQRFDRAEPIHRQNDSIINATSFGPLCKPTAGSCEGPVGTYPVAPYCLVNYGIFSVKSIPAEQCLFLNVFIPVRRRNVRKKAIFMWIHGGSGQVGTGNVFDGTVFAALGNIIVVTFNFRLNLFGFLSSGDDRLEGNLGLYDQALVLDWIYDNADALGGDINRITVGGHSAGAPHAYYLAESPLSKRRIRRIILQSGSPFNIWSHLKPKDAMAKFNVVANDNACGHWMTFDEKFKCLQERDFDIIAEHEHHSYTSANHTNVVASGKFMSRFREEFEQNNTLADVDILIGAVDDEGVFVAIVPILMEQTDQDLIVLNNVNLTAITLKFLAEMQPNRTCLHQQALEFYNIHQIPPNCSFSVECYCSAFYNYSHLVSDILFNNDYYRFIDQRLKYSNRTYIYQYSYRSGQEHPTPCNEYFHRRDLVGHFAELEYTWGTPILYEKNNSIHGLTPLIEYIRYELNTSAMFNVTHTYTDEEILFSKQLIQHWSNFIKHGRPMSSLLKQDWPSVSNISTASMMHLQLNRSEIKPLEIPAGVLFWKKNCPINDENSNGIIRKNNHGIVDGISFIILFCSLLFNQVLNYN